MMEIRNVQDLLEEAKKRTVVWALCIFILSYFLSLTSSSLWFNIPIATLLFVGLRYLSFELEIRKRVKEFPIPPYLSHLLKHQLTRNDYLLRPPSLLASTGWKRKIDSFVLEAAINDFTWQIVREFVTDLWYSSLTTDQEVPEQLCIMINDIFGEIAQRVKRINLINFLTRDVVELVGNHLELFRQAKASIGVKVLGTLSSEEREEKLKQALLHSKQLHPACLSPDSESKVLRQLMNGVVALLLRPEDAQCKLLKGIARELLACAVLRPVMSFASPSFINEVIERAVLSSSDSEMQNKKLDKNEVNEGGFGTKTTNNSSSEPIKCSGAKNPEGEHRDMNKSIVQANKTSQGLVHKASTTQGDWAQTLVVVSQRREQTLEPENLDNMWTKGRNYKKKEMRNQAKTSLPSLPNLNESSIKALEKLEASAKQGSSKVGEPLCKVYPSSLDDLSDTNKRSRQSLEFHLAEKTSYPTLSNQPNEQSTSLSGERISGNSQVLNGAEVKQRSVVDLKVTGLPTSKHPLEASFDGHTVKNSESEVQSQSRTNGFDGSHKVGGMISSQENMLSVWGSSQSAQFDSSSASGWLDDPLAANTLDSFTHSPTSQLNCWVAGAHLENSGAKAFAVYSIAVTDRANNTWIVDRRFRNFEQLHRRLRDLPQYNLQLPPKRFLSSSLDDAFVRERCISLDKYLRELLSIASIAELHEVWDFLSVTSKNYTYTKSPSVMKTIAVNVDDAVDDVFRQLKGVSEGIFRRVGAPLSPPHDDSRSLSGSTLTESGHVHDNTLNGRTKSGNLSDDEYGSLPWTLQESKDDGWHSDSEVHVGQHLLDSENNKISERSKSDVQAVKKIEIQGSDSLPREEAIARSDILEDDLVVPADWTPPKLTVPLLNLVDDIFQLQAKGWIRRQVFWMAKQILQVGMGDAIDDWLVTQVQLLRREDVAASTIRMVHNLLWPGGVFITKVPKDEQSTSSGKVDNRAAKEKTDESALFVSQLVASRRAKVVHEILVDGAPAALVSLIGKKQYTKCAKDIYYFLQSTVFIKQLAFSLLEILLTATFPELNSLVIDVRRGTC